jgi:hypothetical protein
MPKPSSALQSLAGQVIFVVGPNSYTAADVVLAAKAWGDWQRLEQEIREGIACIRHARAKQEAVLDEDVEALADEFRSQRGLFAAEDAEVWLAERQVTFNSWMKYIRWCWLRQKWQSYLQDLPVQYPVSQDQLNRNARVVGVCSGHFAAFARKLAGRAAVHDRIQQETATGQNAGEHQKEIGIFEFPFDIEKDARLLGLSSEEFREKQQRLAELEHSFRQFSSQVIVPERIQGQISAHHLDWIRIEALSLSFPEEPAAREAALCVREDGEELSTVAARTKTALRQEQMGLGELDPSAQAAFLSARKGDLVGPLRCDQELKLFLVLDKVMPSSDNPELRTRAEQLILRAAIKPEVDARVQWQAPWWSDSYKGMLKA